MEVIMEKFKFEVEVEAESAVRALNVIENRIDHDEDYGYDYTIDVTHGPKRKHSDEDVEPPQISEASMEMIVTEATDVAFANKDGGILGSWSIRKAVEHAFQHALEEGIVQIPEANG
jgi:hypothetical protein